MPGKNTPYRGDGNPIIEPRRHFVNLRKLRWRLARDITVIIAFVTTITFLILRSVSDFGSDDKTYIVILVIIWTITAILIVGILKLNNFRKGYDIDTSRQEEKMRTCQTNLNYRHHYLHIRGW